MLKLLLITSVCGLALTLPSIASAQVIGISSANVNAQSCYQSAKYVRATPSSLGKCDAALKTNELSTKDRAAVHVNRGILRRASEDIQGAFDDYKAALTLMPDLPEAKVNRANIYYISGHFDKALADYDAALAANIDDERAVSLNRAMVLAEMGRHSEARAGFNDVIARHPDYALAQEKLTRFKANRPPS